MNKKEQIIFLEPWPEIMIYKIAKLLKERGYETVSIRILKNGGVPDSFFREAFDKIISFEFHAYKINLKNLLLIIDNFLKNIKAVSKAIKDILKLKPNVIICRATPSWPCALTKKIIKKVPVIYFPYDIRAIGLEKSTDLKKYGVKKFELTAERFCFENADGLIHKGHPNEISLIREEILGKNLNITKNRLNFHPYCSKEFFVPLCKNKLSNKDHEFHFVYIGSIGAVGLGKENYILKWCRALIESKIHIHVYAKSNSLPSSRTQKLLVDDFDELLKNKYFHLHDPLGPKEIVAEISKYDYGLLLVSEPLPKINPEIRGGFSIGNKNATYLEAGIPCLYDEGVVFIGALMKKYRVGFSLGDINKISKLKDKLKKTNYKNIEKNILKAREEFLMENNLSRFENFINESIKKNFS